MSIKQKFMVCLSIMLIIPIVMIILLSLIMSALFVLLHPTVELSIVNGLEISNPIITKFLIIWAAAAILIIISGVIAITAYLSRSILKPVKELTAAMERLKNGGPFPMFTSCCPAWVKYLENENPKYLKNISTCKSPMEMVGAIFRDKYAEKDAQDGRTTYHIAIMPCTAKKMEAARPEFIHDGRPDVDLVLTTHEVIDMMQETGIQLNELELESPDLPFGLGSGAAVIYGTTGGVAEAVVRHCLPDKSKNALREISILGLRGDAPIKETTVTIGDTELKLAVVNGLANARKLLKRIDEGEAFYHLIEVMTCQGGCVGGAGQPYGLKATKEKRGDGLHQSDNAAMFKRAERNPIVVRMMAEYGEERCHELLHVSYRGE